MSRVIYLDKGQATLLDDEDYIYLNRFKWYAQRQDIKYKETYYAVSTVPINGKQFSIHRLILKPRENMQVDHINGNTLDNRKENLRIVTRRENARNRHHKKSSKYTGVSWNTEKEKWVAAIFINNKQKFLGRFDDEYEAHLRYEKEVEKLT